MRFTPPTSKSQARFAPPVKRKQSRYNTIEDRQLVITQPDWMEHWKEMPEFNQKRQEEFQAIIVRFSKKEDVEKFAEVIAQKITFQTKSIWFPKLIHGELLNAEYV